MAAVIGYARRRRADGGAADPLVAEAIRTQVAHVISGGYHRRERALAKAVRDEVLAANGGRCMACKAQPATEVDHIDDDSPDRSNLQGLCGPCHRAKTAERIHPLRDGDDPVRFERARDVNRRIRSAVPIRLCDDPDQWPTVWRDLSAKTKRSRLRTSSGVLSAATGAIDRVEAKES